MGTPEFAVASLQAISRAGHRILSVVTVPDQPQGRGLKTHSSDVKKAAEAMGLPILQPVSLRDPGFLDALSDLSADLYVVVAFRILPREVFALAPHGAVNLHASLLPRYRGAAPIQWALINGDAVTGVTTFRIQEKVDTGNMIMQRSLPVPPEMTAGELHDALAAMGAEVLVESLRLIDTGKCEMTAQNDGDATPAPKIHRGTAHIDWSSPALSVHNLVRAMSPYPGAWTESGDSTLKVLRTRNTGRPGSRSPGALVIDGSRLYVSCSDELLEVLELQQQGRKAMDAAAFLRGARLSGQERWGIDHDSSNVNK
jgi:methionyl-tRNA formyltransferase